MSEVIDNISMIAIRGMTILPDMVIHFDVSRKKSINAVEYAMKINQQIFLVTQKSVNELNPGRDDLYDTGTVAEIKQVIKLPNNLVRVLVRGIKRGKIVKMTDDENMLFCDVEIPDSTDEVLSDNEKDAMVEMLHAQIKKLAQSLPTISKETYQRYLLTGEPEELIYKVASECPLSIEEKQKILEADTLKERFMLISVFIDNHIEIAQIKQNLTEEVKDKVNKNQKEYILKEQLHLIREELGEEDSDSEADEFATQVKKLKADKAVKEKINREIKRYNSISANSSEASVVKTYIETMLELPWNKMSKDNTDILNAEQVLEADHYGLKKVKERILEYLAVRTLTKKGDSPIICLVGPPGTGKTSVAASVARALNKKYVRICLGGVRDEAEIRGHRRTYVGAMPGRIINGLRQAGVANPLMLLDEIDKTGTDSRGDTASALLEILDSEQNSKFRDHYIDTPVDLSQVLFLATANDIGSIPKPLLDRMEVIEINSYTENEKFHIATEYLIRKQFEKNGIKPEVLDITDDAVRKIIASYTREAGVRNLDRQISKICQKTARKLLTDKTTAHYQVTADNLSELLGKEKYEKEYTYADNQIGIVTGLAWTSVGGTTLSIEVNKMPGKGDLNLTGKLGDVMKESAQTAYSYVKFAASNYGIKADFFKHNDLHIHIPEGAVPKDGPSAGITMATAIMSVAANRYIDSSVAMTGEITLRGRVLPIGGLKEKLLAAKAAGIKKVLVPEKNRKDVDEFETEITEGLTIIFVKSMDEVLANALA